MTANARCTERRRLPWFVELDLIHDAVPDIEAPPPAVEGVVVESLTDLRANKLTCILSRSEPRDLVDLMFLDRAGSPPELDLALALRKDGLHGHTHDSVRYNNVGRTTVLCNPFDYAGYELNAAFSEHLIIDM